MQPNIPLNLQGTKDQSLSSLVAYLNAQSLRVQLPITENNLFQNQSFFITNSILNVPREPSDLNQVNLNYQMAQQLSYPETPGTEETNQNIFIKQQEQKSQNPYIQQPIAFLGETFNTSPFQLKKYNLEGSLLAHTRDQNQNNLMKQFVNLSENSKNETQSIPQDKCLALSDQNQSGYLNNKSIPFYPQETQILNLNESLSDNFEPVMGFLTQDFPGWDLGDILDFLQNESNPLVIQEAKRQAKIDRQEYIELMQQQMEEKNRKKYQQNNPQLLEPLISLKEDFDDHGRKIIKTRNKIQKIENKRAQKITYINKTFLQKLKEILKIPVCTLKAQELLHKFSDEPKKALKEVRQNIEKYKTLLQKG